MDFTREPVIQTVITPKEGCKLVVRSSKGLNQEEYFVDAVEVVSFGEAFFFRSVEKPKCFLLPVSDYEVLEVREARMVLKHVGVDRSIKISGGREGLKPAREPAPERVVAVEPQEDAQEGGSEETGAVAETRGGEPRSDKKRDRRRRYGRRRSRDEREEGGAPREEAGAEKSSEQGEQKRVEIPEPGKPGEQIVNPGSITMLLPPPPTLISETIARYREDALFKEAFYSRTEKEEEESEEGEPQPVVDDDAAHPVIPTNENPPQEGNEGQWNFSEELSKNNQNDR